MSQQKAKGSNGNGGGGTQAPPPEVKLTQDGLMALKNVHCPNKACGGRLFLPCLWLKKLPLVHPGNITSRNKLIPVSLHYCLKCGQEFGPNEADECFG